MSTYWREGDIRGYTIDELVTFYLGEHPEDDQGVGSQIYVDDGRGPFDVMTYPVTLRFSEWGVKNGYFKQENHVKLVKMIERMEENSK